MPQKKNPDACELIRGKTGRVIGALTGALATFNDGIRAYYFALAGLLWLLGPVFFLTTLSRGLVSPNVTHAALERIPHMAGAGSAIIGAMQMLTGACAGFIVGMMFDRFGVAGVIMTMTGFAVPARSDSTAWSCPIMTRCSRSPAASRIRS